MARGKSQNNAPSARSTKEKQAEFIGFLNVTLSAEEKEDFESVRQTTDIAGSWLAECLRIGISLSVKHSVSEECFRATLTAFRQALPFAGYCIAARAGDPLTAVERVVYIHHYVLGDDWSDLMAVRREDDGW